MANNLIYVIIISLFFIFACSNDENKNEQVSDEKTILIQGFPNSGKIVRAMHGGGYTYMQVENADKKFWVASTMMNVSRNDKVTWTDASLMKDFKSSTLRRTFDEILFITSASVIK